MPSRAALARHPLAIAGAVITTVAAVVFIALTLAVVFGLLNNPYAGLLVFVFLPAVFVLGLLLIPLGMWLQARKLRTNPAAVAEWGVVDFRKAAVRRGALVITALTAVNLVILLLGGYGALHYMESPAFCGQTCHTPMHPQFTAWEANAHSQVACTQCHVGEGAKAFVHYKLVGVRQLFHVATNKYPRPIPGVADMRPALEICTHCHAPQRGFPDRVRVIREFAEDEANTETTTVLQMFLGGPGQPTRTGRAIHRHADAGLRIEYVTTDKERQNIPWVKVTNEKGEVKEYTSEGTTPEQLAQGERRTMDCLDCHNTVAHRIAPTPERAVDNAMAAGRIDRTLPFVRREAVRLLKEEHPDQETGLKAIDEKLRAFYAAHGKPVDSAAVGRAVETIKKLYGTNVFPVMKVTWGVYPDNIGHVTSNGCFRCHDGGHTAKDGTTIDADCEYCHRQIETPTPPQQVGTVASR